MRHRVHHEDHDLVRLSIQPLPSIKGNLTIVEQIFTNVLSNALKFTRADQTPMIDIRAESTGQEQLVFVTDHGIGIAPEHRAKVFRLFQRLHDNEKEYPGTGLGLAMVKKGIERIGGRVRLDERVTEGTCVCLHFQRPPEAKEA